MDTRGSAMLASCFPKLGTLGHALDKRSPAEND
jgi:hypothetical protein